MDVCHGAGGVVESLGWLRMLDEMRRIRLLLGLPGLSGR